MSCSLAAWCANQGLTPDLAAQLANGWRASAYRKGSILFHQGNAPFGLFFLCTGQAKLTRREPGGRLLD